MGAEIRAFSGSLSKIIIWSVAIIMVVATASVVVNQLAIPSDSYTSPEDEPTSQTDGIQEAIDDLPSYGGLIYLPSGVYDIENQIDILQDNITIIGDGYSTILRVKNQPTAKLTENVNIGDLDIHVNDVTGFVVGERIQMEVGVADARVIESIDVTNDILTLTTGAGVGHSIDDDVFSVMSTFYVEGDNCRIMNLKIDGNNNNWSIISAQCGAAYEIQYEEANNFLVDRVEVDNSKHRPFRGIGNFVTVKDCYFHNMSTSGGVHVEGIPGRTWNHVLFDNCHIEMPSGIESSAVAFTTSFGSEFIMRNCYIYGHAAFRVTEDMIIEGCTFVPNDDAAHEVWIYGSDDVVFRDNMMLNETLRLKRCTIEESYDCERVWVVSNNFHNDAHLVVEYYQSHIQITNNIFNGTTTYTAIEVAGTAAGIVRYVQITENMFINCTGSYTTKIRYTNFLGVKDNMQIGCVRNVIDQCGNVSLTDNHCIKFTSYVFYIIGVTDMMIQDNLLTDCGSRGISLHSATHGATDVLIMGNILDAITPYLNDGSYTSVTMVDNIT